MPNKMLPEGWNKLTLDECIDSDRLPKKPSIPQRDYQPLGKYPVVDQGAELIAGYCDVDTAVYRDHLPLILFGDHTRIFKFLDFPFATGADGTKLLKPNSHIVEPLFLYYALRNIDLPSRGYNRHFRILREQVIRAPTDRDEQKRIAWFLKTIEDSVEVESAICDKLAALKSATMAKLFREGLRGEPLKQTEIGEIPESWEVVRLGDLCSRIDYGTSQRCSEEPTAHPVLRIPNIIHGMIDTINLKYAEVGVLTEREIEKLRLVPGDLLFVRTNGNRQYTGRCAVYEGRPAGALFASYLIRVRLPSGAVDPFFVQQYLSEVGREQITRRANPAADGKFNVDTGILRDLKIPRPSLSEQQEIVAVLAALDERRLLARRCHASLERLFSSVLNALMTGAIRVKDLDLAEVSHA
jgi:type I restriction enzyme S subunit